MNTPIRQTCSNATLSLVFGILGWFVLPMVGPLIAIICGHLARAEIARSQGQLDGDGMAVAGLVLGYLQIGLALLAIACIVLFFGGLLAFFAYFGHHVGV